MWLGLVQITPYYSVPVAQAKCESITLCYQCQTWPLTKKQYNKIFTYEMRRMRKAESVTRKIKEGNDDISQMIWTTPCLQYIQKQRIKWFGHLTFSLQSNTGGVGRSCSRVWINDQSYIQTKPKQNEKHHNCTWTHIFNYIKTSFRFIFYQNVSSKFILTVHRN